MYGPFNEYFGRRIVLTGPSGEDLHRGILIDKDDKFFKIELVDGEIKSVSVEGVDKVRVAGYRTFIKHRIYYNDGRPVSSIVYRNDTPIDELGLHIKEDQVEHCRSIHTEPLCWYAEIYYEGKVLSFDDVLKRNRFISEKIDSGETSSLWEWEWKPDNHWDEKCRKEGLGEWRLNWHTSLSEEDDTPILRVAVSQWKGGSRRLGVSNRDLYFYDPTFSLTKQKSFPEGWPYEAWIRYYDDQDKANEVIKKWPFGFQFMELDEEPCWRYRDQDGDLCIDVRRLGDIDGPLPVPRIFGDLAWTKASKIFVLCQVDEDGRATIIDRYNRSITLDDPVLMKENERSYVQAFGQEMGDEYKIINFECKHEAIYPKAGPVDVGLVRPFIVWSHQVRESE